MMMPSSQEHLHIIWRPENLETYLPQQYPKRERLFAFQSVAGWRSFFEGTVVIIWVVTWWCIPSMMFTISNLSYTNMLGLLQPMHQYGHQQRISGMDIILPTTRSITHLLTQPWSQYMSRRPRLTMPAWGEINFVSSHYLKWMTTYSYEEWSCAHEAEVA